MTTMSNQSEINTQNQNTAFFDKIDEHRQEWTDIIDKMCSDMKDLGKLGDLLCQVYSQRHRAVETYLNITTLIARQTRDLNKKKSDTFAKLRNDMQLRVTESAISNQVNAIYADDVYILTVLENYAKYIQDVIKTLDGINFNIKDRIRLVELTKGLN